MYQPVAAPTPDTAISPLGQESWQWHQLSTADSGRTRGNAALGARAAVVLLTAGISTGLVPAELIGGDFVNLGLLGLAVATGASLCASSACGVGRRRALIGVAFALVPVVLLAYFLAFTVS